MKIKTVFLCMGLLLAAGVSSAQGVRFSSQVLQRGSIANVSNAVILPTSPIISFCNAPASGMPCANKATTYTDSTLGTPCASNMQLVLDGTATCTGSADAQDNWGVWAAAGQYAYTITVGGVNLGPYYVTLGGSNTSSDCTPTVHGLVPTPPNDATKFLDGTCHFSPPTGGVADINSQYFIPSCGALLHCQTLLLDAKKCLHAGFTSGSTTVTTDAACPAFVLADVGKAEFGTSNCSAVDDTPGPCINDVPTGTITGFTNAHQVTVSLPAAFTSVGGNSPFYWGHIETAAINAGVAAMYATPTSPKAGVIGCGTTMFDADIFQFPTQAIGISPDPAGIEGCPSGGTVLVAVPKYTATGTGTGTFLNQSSFLSEGENGIAITQAFRNILFTCGGANNIEGGGSIAANITSLVHIKFFSMMENVSVQGCWRAYSNHTIYAFDNEGGTMVNDGAYASANVALRACGPLGTVAQITGGLYGGGATGSNPPEGMTVGVAGGAGGCKVQTNGVYFTDGQMVRNEQPNSTWTDLGSFHGNIHLAGGSKTRLFGGSQSSSGIVTNDGGDLMMSGVDLPSGLGAGWYAQSAGSFVDGGDNHFPAAMTITGGTVSGTASITGTAVKPSNWVLTGWGTAPETSVATDNFNRANGNLGANWTGGDGTAGGAYTLIQISSNQVTGNNNNTNTAFWNASAFNNDQYAKLTLSTVGAGPIGGIGPCVRCGTTTGFPTGYMFAEDPQLGNWQLLKCIVPGGCSSLATASITPAAGDVMELSVLGTTLTSSINGVVVNTTTDATFASGKAGIVTLWTNVNTLGDTWEGGNFAQGSSVTTCDGFSKNERCTVTVGPTPAANPSIAVTFPVPFMVAPQCTVQDVGGTATISPILPSGATTTGVTLTYQGSPTATQTVVPALACGRE